MRPALKRTAAVSREALTRHGRIAAVLLIDDSLSSGAGRARVALEDLRSLALAYLDTLVPGDEVSILPLSQLTAPIAAEPLFDLQAAHATVASLQPTALASDIPRLLDAGVAQLSRHLNPGAELVLVHDGRKDGWQADQSLRWAELRQRLRGPPDATPGTRQRPHLLRLSPAPDPALDNLAITEVRIDRTLISTRWPVGVQVALQHFGTSASRPATLRLLADGQSVGEKTLTLEAGRPQSVTFPCTFTEPGSHLVQARLENARDCLPLDDTRSLAVQVEESVPVLLISGSPTAGLRGDLGFLAAALDPEDSGQGPFRLSRVAAAALEEGTLQRHRVVVLGDISALSHEGLAALEQHVVSGGGVLAGLGNQTDPKLVNRLWARGGNGFLPAALKDRQRPTVPAELGTVNSGHPVLAAFGPQPEQAWKEGRVQQYWQLDTAGIKPGELDLLLSLSNGDPLLVERRRGLGLAALWTTSLNAQWNDLPLQPAYVPLVRNLIGHLGSHVMPPRNLRPGEPLSAIALDTNANAIARGPQGDSLPLHAGAWEGRPALISPPLTEPGGYTVQLGPQTLRYAVASDPEESRLIPLAPDLVAGCLGEVQSFALQTPEAVTRALSTATRQSVEIWRWLVIACLLLLFAETWLTRRQTAVNGRLSPWQRARNLVGRWRRFAASE